MKYFKINRIKETRWYKFSKAAKEIRKINLKYLCLAKLPECDNAKVIKFILNSMLNTNGTSVSSEITGLNNTGKYTDQLIEIGFEILETNDITEVNFENPLDNEEIRNKVKKLKRNRQVKNWIKTVKIIDDLEISKNIKHFYNLIKHGTKNQLELFYNLVNLINILEFLKDGETPNAEIYHDKDGFDLENGKYVLELAKLDDKDDLDILEVEEEDYIKIDNS